MSGQVTGLYVKLSLVPVMGGLALCSANELSFNMLGFVFALTTNISECAQNVYSKMLISGDTFRYSPSQMQFYTSRIDTGHPVKSTHYHRDIPRRGELHGDPAHDVPAGGLGDHHGQLLVCYCINGVFFHCQTIAAYYLMDYISPVTHSVANTGKVRLNENPKILYFTYT